MWVSGACCQAKRVKRAVGGVPSAEPPGLCLEPNSLALSARDREAHLCFRHITNENADSAERGEDLGGMAFVALTHIDVQAGSVLAGERRSSEAG